jgi:hypothetical protein
MSAEIPQFKGISFAGIPADGAILDGSAFANEKFREGKTLHYTPANA